MGFLMKSPGFTPLTPVFISSSRQSTIYAIVFDRHVVL